MVRKLSMKLGQRTKRKEKQNQELCVLCFFFVHLAYFVLHSHTITNKPIRTKRNKEHTFTTPLCSFLPFHQLQWNDERREEMKRELVERRKKQRTWCFPLCFVFLFRFTWFRAFITNHWSERNTKDKAKNNR